MALYHVSIKVAAKDDKGGMRASSHYAYIGRAGRYQRLETDEELVYVESGNLPSWAKADASIFWLASDSFERKNGSVYRELEAALPRELSSEQQHVVVSNFIDQVLYTHHPYSFAIHSKLAADGLPQPHVHLMWSERRMDGIDRDPVHFFRRASAARRRGDGRIKKNPDLAEGGCKKISMYSRIDEFRELWATLTNDAYKKAGIDLSISHLSLEDRGIGRKAERHLGPSRMQGDNRKILLARREALRAAEEAEADGLRIIKRLASMRAQQSAIRELFCTTALMNIMNARDNDWFASGAFKTGSHDDNQSADPNRTALAP